MPIRALIPLALLAVSALPAGANGTFRQGGSPNHPIGAVRHRDTIRLPPLHEILRFHRTPFGGGFARNGFLHRGFSGGAIYYGGTAYDYGGFPTGDGNAVPPQVIAMAPPPPPSGNDRATVETTASGVTIIRGPGSHRR
jgi:hypothetical protein